MAAMIRLFGADEAKMSELDKHWFTEVYEPGGIAFSLKIKEKLHDEQSEFQHIEVYATETFGNLMIIDGCTMVSQRENFVYHEMMSHPVLFSHPNPEHVAIIGGGDCGTLREVLKHDCVKSATQIDIDERVTRVSEMYFPELCESNDDPRAKLMWIDGLKWMADRDSESLDIIIVDSTDPEGPGEILFTREFFTNCFRALKPGGLFVQQSESPLLHAQSIIKPMHEKLRDIGYADTHTVQLPQVIYPSGWWSATMARKGEGIRFERESEAESKAFSTEYYNAGIHRGGMVMPEFLERLIND